MEGGDQAEKTLIADRGYNGRPAQAVIEAGDYIYRAPPRLSPPRRVMGLGKGGEERPETLFRRVAARRERDGTPKF